MAQVDNDISTKATKTAKDINKKSQEASLEDKKKSWREKSLHWKIPLRTDNAEVDRWTTDHWLSDVSLNGKIEEFILAEKYCEHKTITCYTKHRSNNYLGLHFQ